MTEIAGMTALIDSRIPPCKGGVVLRDGSQCSSKLSGVVRIMPAQAGEYHCTTMFRTIRVIPVDSPASPTQAGRHTVAACASQIPEGTSPKGA